MISKKGDSLYRESSRPDVYAKYVLVDKGKTVYLTNVTPTCARAIAVQKYRNGEKYMLWTCNKGLLGHPVGHVHRVCRASDLIEWADVKTDSIILISPAGEYIYTCGYPKPIDIWGVPFSERC